MSTWPQTWPAYAAAQARTSPWPQVAIQTTHIRLFLTTVLSPVPPFFFVHTLLWFSFSLISSTSSLLLVTPRPLGVFYCACVVWQWVRGRDRGFSGSANQKGSLLSSALPCLHCVVMDRVVYFYFLIVNSMQPLHLNCISLLMASKACCLNSQNLLFLQWKIDTNIFVSFNLSLC